MPISYSTEEREKQRELITPILDMLMEARISKSQAIEMLVLLFTQESEEKTKKFRKNKQTINLDQLPELPNTIQIAKFLGVGKNRVKALKDAGLLLTAPFPGFRRPVVTKLAVIKCMELLNRISHESI